MGAGPGSWSAVLFLAPAGGRGPRPLGARGGNALKTCLQKDVSKNTRTTYKHIVKYIVGSIVNIIGE